MPLHPLVVHFSISFICVFALICIASVFSSRFFRRLDGIIPTLAIISGALILLGKETGELLAERTTEVDWHQHGQWADFLTGSTFVLDFCAVLWWVLSSEGKINNFVIDRIPQKVIFFTSVVFLRILEYFIIVFSLLVLFFVFLTGHSGAQLVWIK